MEKTKTTLGEIVPNNYTQFTTLSDHLIYLTKHKTDKIIILEAEIFKIALKRLCDLMDNDYQRVADLLKVGKNVIIGWLNNSYEAYGPMSLVLTEECNKIYQEQSQIIFTGRGCRGKMLKDL